MSGRLLRNRRRRTVRQTRARWLPASGKTKPADITATSRDIAKWPDYAAKGVETRAADFDDPASLERPSAGADRILIISTDVLNEPGKRLKQHLAAVEAARKAG